MSASVNKNSDIKKCNSCGAIIPVDSDFCTECGARQGVITATSCSASSPSWFSSAGELGRENDGAKKDRDHDSRENNSVWEHGNEGSGNWFQPPGDLEGENRDHPEGPHEENQCRKCGRIIPHGSSLCCSCAEKDTPTDVSFSTQHKKQILLVVAACFVIVMTILCANWNKLTTFGSTEISVVDTSEEVSNERENSVTSNTADNLRDETSVPAQEEKSENWFADLFQGSGGITEDDMLSDIMSSSSFYMTDGASLGEVEVIKRLTDDDNHRDTIYVKVFIDHPNASETRSYVLNYTEYNEGWMLDSLDQYWDEGSVWKVVPKSNPDKQNIMDALVSDSNAKIDAYNKEWSLINAGDSYFFEEGKYKTTIYEGTRESDHVYKCIAETQRVFEYATVHEEKLLTFVFDEYNYIWQLSDTSIIHTGGNWYVEGVWYEELNDVEITFEYQEGHYGEESYEEFRGYSTDGKYNDEATLILYLPSSDRIFTGGAEFGAFLDPYQVMAYISADDALFRDWNHDVVGEIYPQSLNSSPETLESVGVEYVPIDPAASEYVELGADILVDIFVRRDISGLDNWGVIVSETLQDSLQWYLSDNEYEEYYGVPIHWSSVTFDKNDNSEDARDIFDYYVDDRDYDAVYVIEYCLAAVDGDGTEYSDGWMLFGKIGDDVYLISIE